MPFTPEEGWPEDERNRKKYYLKRSWMRWGIIILAKTVGRIFIRFTIEGLEKIPRNGRVLVAANHLTHFDVVIFEAVMPRYIIWMAKSSLFSTPFKDWLIRIIGGFEVRRDRQDHWAMRFAKYVLEQEIMLGMFIEGTRSKDRQLQKGRPGVVILASKNKCPVVTLSLTGTHKILNPWYRRAPVRIVFSDPIYPQPGERMRALNERIMYTLASRLPPENRGVYANPPPELAYIFEDRHLAHE